MWVITSNLYLRAALIEIIVLNYRAILVPADCPDCLVIVGTLMVTPCGAVGAVPRVVEHLNTSLGFNHCKMWHVCPLCTVMCCPLCTGVMMSSVSSGVLLCWWSHDLWGRHRHTRPRDPEIWGEGHQQQYLPRHDHGTPDHTRINLNHHAHFQLYVACCNFGLGDFNVKYYFFYTSLEWTLLAIKAYYKTTQNWQ